MVESGEIDVFGNDALPDKTGELALLADVFPS